MSAGERALRFQCEGDGLLGILHAPDGPAQAPGVLIIVGGPQYRVGSHRQFTLLARGLAARGHAVMRFDYRGMGDSDGEPRNFEELDADIHSAIDEFLGQVPGLGAVVLWGLCDGASAALLAADHPAVKGLVLVNPWVHTERGQAQAVMRHYYFQRLLQRSFWQKVLSGRFTPLRSLREFFGVARQVRGGAGSGDDASPGFLRRMLQAVQGFGGAILVLISEHDLTAAEFSDLCRDVPAWRDAMRGQAVSWQRLPGADHTFSRPADLQAAVDVTAAWLAAGPQAQA